MICKRCGNINPHNSRYCRHCGAHLEQPGAVLPLPEEEFNLEAEEAAPPNQEEVNRLLERAFGLSERGDLTGAAFLCTQAIELDPHSVSAHSLLGLLYERMGRREEAIVEYERVVELNPASRVDLEHLAQLRGAEPSSPPPRQTRAPALGWFGQSPYLSSVPIVAAVSLGIVFILLANRAAESGFGRRARLGAAGGGPVARLIRTGVNQVQAGQYAAAEDSFREALMLDAANRDAQLWLQRVQRLRRPRLASARREPPHLVGPPLPPQTKRAQSKATAPATSRTVPVPPPPLIPPTAPAGGRATASQPPPTATQAPPARPSRAPQASSGSARNVRTSPPVQPFRPAPAQSGSTPAQPPGSATAGDTGHIVIRTNPERKPGKAHPPRSSTSRASPRRPAPSNARSLEVEAAQSYLNGDTATAEQRYKRSLQTLDPDDPKVAFIHQQLASLRFSRGDYAGARVHYERALAAYRRQLKQGVRIEEAKSGIRACETALRVCNAATAR